MADGEVPRFGTSEWEAALTQRRSHAQGPHMRPAEPDEAMRANDYARNGDVTAVVDELQRRLGAQPPTPKSDYWKWMSGAVAVIGLVITIAGSAQSVVASNQKLLDKIDGMDDRLKIVEARQATNMPRLDEQIRDNKLQDQRIQNAIEANADERKARQDSDMETRKAFVDMAAAVSKLNDRINDLDKAQAVQQERQRRGSLDTPGREAQAEPPGHPR